VLDLPGGLKAGSYLLSRPDILPADYFSKTGGSNLNGKKTYDQLAVTPRALKEKILGYNVFDFDNGIFQDKWSEVKAKPKANSIFDSYMRAYISKTPAVTFPELEFIDFIFQAHFFNILSNKNPSRY